MADIPPQLQDSLGDRYRIERELGAGAMGRVYLAEDRKLGRPVAIKVLRPEIAQSLGTERFLREIRISARLTHPHILSLNGASFPGHQLTIVASASSCRVTHPIAPSFPGPVAPNR